MKNLHEEKLYIQAFREIRAHIIRNGLKPGDQLPTEAVMCGMLGVSRNVLREAMKSMELMGLVRSYPGRGTVVQRFDLDFVFQNIVFSTAGEEDHAIVEMLDLRKHIELSYMSRAYDAMDDEAVRTVRAILETIKAKWARHIFFHADDRDFHMALFEPLGNRSMLSLMDAIWSVDASFHVDQKLKYLDDTVTKHERIVRALEARDKPAFEEAMCAHFASGKYATGASFEEY